MVLAGGEPNTTRVVHRGRASAVQLAGRNAPIGGATKVEKRRQYTAARLPHPEHQHVRRLSPAAARRDRRESVRIHAWSRQCERSRRRRPDRAAIPGIFVDQLVDMEFSKYDGARSRSRAVVVMGSDWSRRADQAPCQCCCGSRSLWCVRCGRGRCTRFRGASAIGAGHLGVAG